jgi:hypothetical protein
MLTAMTTTYAIMSSGVRLLDSTSLRGESFYHLAFMDFGYCQHVSIVMAFHSISSIRRDFIGLVLLQGLILSVCTLLEVYVGALSLLMFG